MIGSECFPVLINENDTQCYRDKIIANDETTFANTSMAIALMLSPTISKVNTVMDIFILIVATQFRIKEPKADTQQKFD